MFIQANTPNLRSKASEQLCLFDKMQQQQMELPSRWSAQKHQVELQMEYSWELL